MGAMNEEMTYQWLDAKETCLRAIAYGALGRAGTEEEMEYLRSLPLDKQWKLFQKYVVEKDEEEQRKEERVGNILSTILLLPIFAFGILVVCHLCGLPLLRYIESAL